MTTMLPLIETDSPAREPRTVNLTCEEAGFGCRGEILNVSAGAMRLLLPAFLRTGRTVQIELSPGFVETGSVLYCQSALRGFVAGISFGWTPYTRKESRVFMFRSATVTQLNSSNAPIMDATTIDSSQSGLGLLLDKPLEAGSLISVSLPDVLIFGEVRHCSPEEGGHFRIGVAIEREICRSTSRDSESKTSHPPVAVRSWPRTVLSTCQAAISSFWTKSS